uniref:Uncharacterized protein n=1 Tax=Anopheles albimanus TaxID=7167 RepID=A0A182FC19_ANOAL
MELPQDTSDDPYQGVTKKSLAEEMQSKGSDDTSEMVKTLTTFNLRLFDPFKKQSANQDVLSQSNPLSHKWLIRHHVLLPVMPIFVSQWCFSPETPDFMCPLYDLGFHIAFEHDTSPELYYRCMYGRAVLLKCPYLHHWDDERKMCAIVEDFRHIHHYPADQPRRTNLQHGNWEVQQYCRHCQRNFLTPRDLDPEAQCSDRMLLACNTDGSLSVYECPAFHFYGRRVQLRWYAEQERCDYPADVEGPWQG